MKKLIATMVLAASVSAMVSGCGDKPSAKPSGNTANAPSAAVTAPSQGQVAPATPASAQAVSVGVSAPAQVESPAPAETSGAKPKIAEAPALEGSGYVSKTFVTR